MFLWLKQNLIISGQHGNQPIAQLLSAYAIGAGGLSSNPGSVKSAQCRQRLATAAMFLRSCVAQALSHGDGPRHSLHTLAYYRKHNKDLIFLGQHGTVSDRG